MPRRAVGHVVVLFLLAWIAFFAHACSAGAPVKERMRVGEVAAAPSVQVGLGRCLREPSVRIAVRGGWSLRDGETTLAAGDEMEWTELRADAKGVLHLGGLELARTPVALVPAEGGALAVEYVKDARGNACRPDAVRYRGKLHLHALGPGKVGLVNEVDLEDYLKGVVGMEMNLGEGEEALKTQVIAARTYAMHEQKLDRIRRVKGERFDLYDDERSQVYGGLERVTPLAERLVDATRGMFLVYEGRLVRAFYSAACGGHTEPAWEVLQDETDRIPPLSGTKCEYCQRRAIYRWKEPVVISKKEIQEKCLPADLRDRRVRTVEITKRLPGGHAVEVTVTLEGTSRTVKLDAIQEFKRKVEARIRSTLWDAVEDRGDAIALVGRGFGHGAGMCQVGAYEMAADGKTASEILEYYFPGAGVRKLY